MIQTNATIYSIGAIADGNVDGLTPDQITVASSRNNKRSGIRIKNHDTSLYLYVYFCPRGRDQPTITSTTQHIHAIGPRDAIDAYVGDGVDVWLLNSSGAGTTSYYSYQELF